MVQFKEFVLIAVTHFSELKCRTSTEDLKTRSSACNRFIHGPLCTVPNLIAVLLCVPFLEENHIAQQKCHRVSGGAEELGPLLLLPAETYSSHITFCIAVQMIIFFFKG